MKKLSHLFLFTICSTVFGLAPLVHASEKPGFLFVNATVTDFEKLGVYGRALPPIYVKYGGIYRIFGGIGRGVDVLAGSAKHESVIFAEFKSLKDVEKFWWSDDYRAVIPLRAGAGTFDVVGLEGTGEPAYTAQEGIQPAYMFTLVTIKDPEKTQAYMEATLGFSASAPGRLIALARPKDMSVLEGPKPDYTIEITSWPSVAAIEAYLSDPEFTKMKALREEAMDFTVMVAEVPKPR
jgi:uncharacterized protein (DUF1330 family)